MNNTQRRKLDAFQRTVVMISEACEQGADVAVPQLSAEKVKAFASELREARKFIWAIIVKLEQGGQDAAEEH
jgi:hypothetical protein